MDPFTEDQQRLTRLKRIHLGCGQFVLPGFINVDARPVPGADLVRDITDLSFLENESCALIYVSHALEHLRTSSVAPFLAQCFAKLAEGGRLMIAVPDLEEIFRQYSSDKNALGLSSRSLINFVYGGQDYEENFHKTGFTFGILKDYLHESGFHSVRRFNADEVGALDSSTVGTYLGGISLNVEASKGEFTTPISQVVRRYGPVGSMARSLFRLLYRIDGRLRRELARLLNRYDW